MKNIEKKEIISIEKRKGIKILYPDYIKEREKDSIDKKDDEEQKEKK